MANIRTIDYGGFNHATGSAATGSGFIIWSGSMQLSKSDAYASQKTQYYGVGIEAIAHSGSYLRFQTDTDGNQTSSLDVRTNKFFLGSDAAYISGSGDGTIAISSSNFELNEGGDVVMQGVITAEAGGTIGGFAIGSNTLTATNFLLDTSAKKLQLGTGNTIFIADADDGIQLGHATFANAPFSVTKVGALKATSGEVAGWTLASDKLTGGNLILKKEGIVQSSDYASNLSGFSLSAASGGFLEVENAKIRGTLATAVFEKETVNAVGGQLYIANSTALTGSVIAGQTNQGGLYKAADTTMSVVNVTGFAANEILSLKRVNATGFQTEYIRIVSSSRQNSSSPTNFAGNIMVTRGYGAGVTATAVSQSLGNIPGAAQDYSGSQVIVSTGKIGTGFIRLNANPNDQTTPYMDIVERTGSGIYDVKLKARLGDLSGIADTVNGTAVSGFGLYTDNAFLKGGIVATYGKIGGFGINATTVSSSNNNLILRSDGQITGSNVLFDGGQIGGFGINATTISSSNNNLILRASGDITASNLLATGATITGDITVTNPNDFTSPTDSLPFNLNGTFATGNDGHVLGWVGNASTGTPFRAGLYHSTSSVVTNNAKVSVVQDSGSNGSQCLEYDYTSNTGEVWTYSTQAFEVDTSHTYRMTVRAKLVSGDGDGDFHAGFACMDANGAWIDESPGQHRYFGSSGAHLNEVGVWDLRTGTITGEGSGAHTKFKTGTKFVRPMFILGYQNKNDKYLIDYMYLENLTTGETSFVDRKNDAGACIKINKSDFGTANNGEMYIHGYDLQTGQQADVSGSIFYRGGVYTLPARSNQLLTHTNAGTGEHNYIVMDTRNANDRKNPHLAGGSGFKTHTATTSSLAAAKLNGAQWTFDPNGAFTNFTPDNNFCIIGKYKSSGTDTISEAEIFYNATPCDILFTGSVGLTATYVNPEIGGVTSINGSMISTGKIQSTNYAASAGSELDLNNGTIKLGGSSAPAFQVTNAGVVTATAGTIGGWTLGASTLTGGGIQLNNAGKIVTSTDTSKTRIEIDGTADPAELRFFSASSNHFEATTNIQEFIAPSLGKGANAAIGTCPAASNSGLSGIELKNSKAGIMSSVGGLTSQIKLFAGHIELVGTKTSPKGAALNYNLDVTRDMTTCGSGQDLTDDVAAIRGRIKNNQNDSGAGRKSTAVFADALSTHTDQDRTTIGVLSTALNFGSGGAYSFYGENGDIWNSGNTKLGQGIIGSATHTMDIGLEGNDKTGLNIINIWGQGDGQNGQTANEIRMHGHEGRAQGIAFSDSDFADKYWWCGTPYQGQQNWWTVGYDDATSEHPRKGAAILAVIGPDSTDAVNAGITDHGSVRICDWDPGGQSNANSTDFMWFMHNGTDARIGAMSGHFDFHNTGDEHTATHNFRFGSDGSFHAINLNTASSGGTTVKLHGNEMKATSSTRKVKKEINDITLDVVKNFNKLRPVEYKQKLDDKPAYGFIAEEVADVHPLLAVWDKDYTRDEKGQRVDSGERGGISEKATVHKLDSDKIVPADIEERALLAVAIAKIQELEERINKLENN